MAMNSTKANKRGGMQYHQLNPAQGFPTPQPLQTHIPIDYDAVTFTVYSGRVMHINPTSKKLRPGIAGTALPLFAFPGGDDYDIKLPVVSPSAYDGDDFYAPGTATGKAFLSLVSLGGFELRSTEYDDAVDEADYAPNVHLTALASNTDITIGGVLTPCDVYTATVCGIVHKGVVGAPQQPKIKMLNFFTCYIPALTQETLNAIAQQTGGEPEGPTLSAVSGVTSSAMTINWQPVSAATRYQVEISLSSTFATLVGTTVNTPLFSHQFTGLTTGTTYYYRVRAVNGAGESTWVTGSQLTS